MSEETNNVVKCKFCAEEISAEAIKCKHCGEFLAESSETQDKPNGILGLIAAFLPMLIAVLMFVWVGSMRLINGPESALNFLFIFTLIGSSILIVIEISALGKKNKFDLYNRRKNSEPAMWLLYLVLCWIIFYPYYFFKKRKEFGVSNIGIVSILSMFLMIISYSVVNNAIEEQKAFIQYGIENFQNDIDDQIKNWESGFDNDMKEW